MNIAENLRKAAHTHPENLYRLARAIGVPEHENPLDLVDALIARIDTLRMRDLLRNARETLNARIKEPAK